MWMHQLLTPKVYDKIFVKTSFLWFEYMELNRSNIWKKMWFLNTLIIYDFFNQSGLSIVGENATVLGWGMINDDGIYAEGLRGVQVKFFFNMIGFRNLKYMVKLANA